MKNLQNHNRSCILAAVGRNKYVNKSQKYTTKNFINIQERQG